MSCVLITLFAFSVFSIGCRQHSMTQPTQNQLDTTKNSNDPLAIHFRAIAIDMHADTVQRVLDEHVDLQQELKDGHLDAVRAKAGGLDAQFFSIWVEPQGM